MEGAEYNSLSPWLGVHFVVKLIRVDEFVLEKDAEKIVVLFLYCVVKRCLPSLVPRVEVEDRLVVASVDLDALADGFELPFPHRNMEWAGLQRVDQIQIDDVTHLHDLVEDLLRHLEVLFVLDEQQVQHVGTDGIGDGDIDVQVLERLNAVVQVYNRCYALFSKVEHPQRHVKLVTQHSNVQWVPILLATNIEIWQFRCPSRTALQFFEVIVFLGQVVVLDKLQRLGFLDDVDEDVGVDVVQLSERAQERSLR